MPANRSLKSYVGAVGLAALLVGCAAGPTMALAADAGDGALRVCADPNNLPFSNKNDDGVENKLANLVAAEFAEPVAYVWHAQRRGFIRETLNAKQCDVVMGVPKRYGLVQTTRPYYRSSYVFVSRADRHLDIQSIKDPRLRTLKIGVQLIGDNGFNTPPAHALAAQGIVNNVAGFSVYGDYRDPNPPAAIVTAVEHGEIDIAAVWGPLAGYFAKKSPEALTITPITDTESFAPLVFQYDIAMGVRKGDDALRAKLDDVIVRKHAQIVALLESYGIPLMPIQEQLPPQAGQIGSKD